MDNMKIEEWKFRSATVPLDRSRLLQQQQLSFAEIVHRIVAEMVNISFHPATGSKEAKGKVRAEFFFNVREETLDLFFNSSCGIRAQYYLDPQKGAEGNRLAIEGVEDKLFAGGTHLQQQLMTLEQIKKSLKYGSAKIWICEDTSTLDQKGRDQEQIVALEVPRWLECMQQVLASWDANQSPCPSNKSRALLGVQAPTGTRMKVLGAWIDGNNQEFVVPSKVGRSLEIHRYGFS